MVVVDGRPGRTDAAGRLTFGVPGGGLEVTVRDSGAGVELNREFERGGGRTTREAHLVGLRTADGGPVTGT